MVLVLAELAAGNAAAAMQACEKGLHGETLAAVEDVLLVWWAHAALACGDTARALEWADRAVRARVHLALGTNEGAAADAYERLAIGAPMHAYWLRPIFLNVWLNWRQARGIRNRPSDSSRPHPQ